MVSMFSKYLFRPPAKGVKKGQVGSIQPRYYFANFLLLTFQIILLEINCKLKTT